MCAIGAMGQFCTIYTTDDLKREMKLQGNEWFSFTNLVADRS